MMSCDSDCEPKLISYYHSTEVPASSGKPGAQRSAGFLMHVLFKLLRLYSLTKLSKDIMSNVFEHKSH